MPNKVRNTTTCKHLNINHKFFNRYAKVLDKKSSLLVGQTPSFYLNDVKPVKYWKLLHATRLLASGENKTMFLKSSKLFNKSYKHFRRKLKTTTYALMLGAKISHKVQNSHILKRFKPFIRRVPTPNYILKWKTSYPLMFTNESAKNRTKKNQLDRSMNYFLKSRFFRRTRRNPKNFFKKIRRNIFKKKSVNKWSYGVGKVVTLFSKKRLLVRRATRKNELTKRYKSTCVRRRKYKSVLAKKLLSTPQQKESSSTRSYKTKFNKLNKKQYGSSHTKTFKPLIKARPLHTAKLTRSLRNIYLTSINAESKSFKLNPLDLNPTITTRSTKNFTLKNLGMFLNSLTFCNQRNPFTYKFLFKKKLFSFLYPNEVRNAIMNRKKRITFYNLVYKLKTKAKSKPRYNMSAFNKFFLRQYKYALSNKQGGLVLNSLFDTKALNVRQQQLHYLNYTTSRDEIMYTDNFSYRGQDPSFRWSEVKIPRVRFKPGYQRMWRRARKALQESLNLKFIYQKQLTRYLVKFYKGSNRYSFSRAEMSLGRVIMYSRLLPDLPTINIFMSQKSIYLNGKITTCVNTILVPNDAVQLIVSMWYYVAYRWIANWTLKRGKKFKKLVYRKGLAGRQKVMKLKKQRSYYTPNWVYLARYDTSDIKPYLEVDYFTLSAIVLYEPFTTYYYSPDETPDYRPTIYRMYNWKYIT